MRKFWWNLRGSLIAIISIVVPTMAHSAEVKKPNVVMIFCESRISGHQRIWRFTQVDRDTEHRPNRQTGHEIQSCSGAKFDLWAEPGLCSDRQIQSCQRLL